MGSQKAEELVKVGGTSSGSGSYLNPVGPILGSLAQVASVGLNYHIQSQQLQLKKEQQQRLIQQSEEYERLKYLSDNYEGNKERMLVLKDLQRWEEMADVCEEAMKQFVASCGNRELYSNEKLVLAEVYHLAAVALFNVYQYEKAAEYCELALKINGKHADFLFLYGKVNLLLGNKLKALNAFQSARSFSDQERQVNLCCYIAFMGFSAKEVISCTDIFEKQKLIFKDEAIHAIKGWAYFTKQRYIAAAVIFKQTIDLIYGISHLNSNTRSIEIQLLNHFISISLTMQLLLDKSISLSIKDALENKLKQLLKLWRSYNQKNNTSLSYTNIANRHYSCFITKCLFSAFIESVKVQLNKTIKPILDDSNDFSLLRELLRSEVTDNNYIEETLSRDSLVEKTLGDGDCAVHAIWGDFDNIAQMYICKDVKEKRKALADACRSSEPGSELYNIMWEEIKNLIMDKEIAVKGENLIEARNNYSALEKQNNDEVNKKWQELRALFSDQLVSFLHSKVPEGDFKVKFHTCLNEHNQELIENLEKSAELNSKFQEYNSVPAIPWDEILKNSANILEEYLQERIEKSGVHLTSVEVQLIAYAFNLKIKLWTKDRYDSPSEARCVNEYNEAGATEIAVQFNGVNHFERRRIVSTAKEEETIATVKIEDLDEKDISKIDSPILTGLHRYLQMGFEMDPYDPANLLLLSAFDSSDFPIHIQSQAQLAKAHLAYCYIHGYRVLRNFTEALYLANSCDVARAKAEYGFIVWHVLGLSEANIEQAGDLFFAAVQNQKHIENSEINGFLRAKLYSALLILEGGTQEGRREAIKMLRDIAYEGIVLAQAWLANIYAFGLYGINVNAEKAENWLIRAISNPYIKNKPDYFFACLVHSRIHREGAMGYPVDLVKSREILLTAINMGSTECMIELAMLYCQGNIHCDGSLEERSTLSASEEDREVSMSLLHEAINLGFDSRRVYNYPKEVTINDSYYRAVYHQFSTKNICQELATKLLKECVRVSSDDSTEASIQYYLDLIGRSPSKPEKRDHGDAELKENPTKKELTKPRWESKLRLRLQDMDSSLVKKYKLRPSLASNTNGDVVLIYKDPAGMIVTKLGKVNKEHKIDYFFNEIISPFQDVEHEHVRVTISNNIIVCCGYSLRAKEIDYRVGRTINKSITWNLPGGSDNYTHGGSLPVIALNDEGTIVELHCHQGGGSLYFRVGRINKETAHIEQWFSSRGVAIKRKNQIQYPSLAVSGKQVVVAWQEKKGIVYLIGSIQNQTIVWAPEQILTGPYTTPHCILDGSRFVLLLGGEDKGNGLYYSEGQLNGQIIEWKNQFQHYGVGYWPTGIMQGDTLLTVQEFYGNTDKPSINSHHIQLSELKQLTSVISNNS
jgi:TPR repeat protein